MPVLVLAAVALPAAPAAGKPKPIPASSAFNLPSTHRCVADRSLTVSLRRVRHVTWKGATVKVDGKRVKTIKRSQVGKRVTLRALPRGRFVLAITAKADHRRSAKATRAYHPCAPTPSSLPEPQ